MIVVNHNEAEWPVRVLLRFRGEQKLAYANSEMDNFSAFLDEIEIWLTKEIGQENVDWCETHSWVDDQIQVQFKNPQHAVMFKLRFS